MTELQAVLLGLLQGLTEFLPISSSGHLVLAEAIFRVPFSGNIAFEVFVHFGTFLSLLTIFRGEVLKMLVSLGKATGQPMSVPQLYRENEYFRLAALILIGSVPAAAVGFSFEHLVEEFFSDPKLVSVMLLVTGVVLLQTRRAKPQQDRDVRFGSSLLIGVAQAVAIVPGISRSGLTISMGLFLRVSRANSARFSLLLALPAVLGATALKVGEVIASPPSAGILITYIVGTVSAYLSGVVAIKALLELIKKGKFSVFAYYCFLIGTIGIFFI